MSTSHHRDGPDSILLSGPLPGLHPGQFGTAGFAAFFANDNPIAPPPAGQPDAEAVMLCQERDAQGRPIIAIRLVMADAGEFPLLYATPEQHDIIALWRAAGQGMNLPLALRDAMGEISFITRAPGELSFARRGGSALSGRRPRVMRRRQPPLKAFAFRKKTRKA